MPSVLQSKILRCIVSHRSRKPLGERPVGGPNWLAQSSGVQYLLSRCAHMPPGYPGIYSGVLTVRALWLTMMCCRYRYCNGLDNSSMKLAQWPNLLRVEVAAVSTNTSKTPPAIGSLAIEDISRANSVL